MTARPLQEAGFSLVEAMVALVIFGIAAAGIVRAAEAHVDAIYALERRAAAQWVAQNALAELSLGSKRNMTTNEVPMLGWRWSVESELAASKDPDLRLATVRVRPSGSRETMVTLKGFVDIGGVTS